MAWLYFTIGAYLINAIAFIVDKYLLSSPVAKPTTYAFWVAILSSAVVVLIPFGVAVQSYRYLVVAAVSGATFFIALIFLYKAVKNSDISVASTMVGVMTAVFTYILAVYFLRESASVFNVISIVFLVAGTLFLGKAGEGIWSSSVWGGIFFGISFVLLKIALDDGGLINGIFWTRIGLIVSALAALLIPAARRDIFLSFRRTHPKFKALFIGNKILAGLGFTLLYYAIRLGKVSVVNSMLGFQFLFILVLALIFRSKLPMIEVKTDRRSIIRKTTGIILILTGFLMVLIY